MGKKNIPYIEETYDVVVVYGECGQYCTDAV